MQATKLNILASTTHPKRRKESMITATKTSLSLSDRSTAEPMSF